ncbi:hypothetical protein VNO77_02288 [Canavalia gladiata]|uniref:Uncharacterized protein n=1 Tax=Canavalia gladiata TaxID=3824 RepID=A0AAN9R737_CANGL
MIHLQIYFVDKILTGENDSSSDNSTILSLSTHILLYLIATGINVMDPSVNQNERQRRSSNHIPIHSLLVESGSRRSRPSFLDSPNCQPEQHSSMSNHLEPSSNDIAGYTYFHKPSKKTSTVPLFSNVTTTNVHSPPEQLTTPLVVNDNNQGAWMISVKEYGKKLILILRQ